MRRLKKHKESIPIAGRWLIYAGFLLILLVFGKLFVWDMPDDPYAHTRAIGIAVFQIIPALIGLIICLIPGAIRKWRKDRAETSEQIASGRVAVYAEKFRYMSGLPETKGVPCWVKVYADRLLIKTATKEFIIPMAQIVNSVEYADTKTQQYLETHWGEALLGGMAFGSTGAIIGGMPKARYRRHIDKYNVAVNYVSKDGKDKAVVLSRVTGTKGLTKIINQYAGRREAVQSKIEL